jgi:rhamnulokinase
MDDRQQYLAVDLGAESGRVMLGVVAGERIELSEIHRFPNGPTEIDGTLRWDFDALMGEIKTGIRKAIDVANGPISGIGVDSWGVDFGLLDDEGNLLEPPYHYRDSRTDGMMDAAFALMPRVDIYANTGIQFMQLNTAFQLLAMVEQEAPMLAQAKGMTFMADLVSHALSGKLYSEYTLASTSQLLDMNTAKWSESLLDALGIPKDLLPEVVAPCTVVGKLRPEVCAELACEPIPVIAVASHDTGAAVAAVPAEGENWAYLSSGTWSLMGVEIPKPIITEETCNLGFTNEGGVGGAIRLLKNITGLWLLQECRREWQRQGRDFSYAELTDLARAARPFAARIEPDHAPFLSPGDMPNKINAYLAETGQSPLKDPGDFARAILEALAFSYRKTLDSIEGIIGQKIDVVHIVGGGAQNELLNQFAANALNRRIIIGPIEATATGNILLQARATGQIDSLEALRKIVRNSFDTKEYAPESTAKWDEEYVGRIE